MIPIYCVHATVCMIAIYCVYAIANNFIYSPNHCSICKSTIPVTALFGTLMLNVQH